MFAADESTVSNLEKLAKWAGKAKVKAKSAISSVKAAKSVIKDIREVRRPVSNAEAANAELVNSGEVDEIFGISSTYVYVGAGLLIAAGIGYIAYNRIKS